MLIYRHPDGGKYLKVSDTEYKDDVTGEWSPAVAYWSFQNGKVYTTSAKRWHERFVAEQIPLEELSSHTHYGFPSTSFDARVWAEAFMQYAVKNKMGIDEDLMTAWFANAIMRGFDEHGDSIFDLRDQLAEQEAHAAQLAESLHGSANEVMKLQQQLKSMQRGTISS
jgi:hypothetical protein